MASSRLWRVAAHLGLVEDRRTEPRAGTTAWWSGLVPPLVVAAVVVLVTIL